MERKDGLEVFEAPAFPEKRTRYPCHPFLSNIQPAFFNRRHFKLAVMRITLLLLSLLFVCVSMSGQAVYFSMQYSMFPGEPSVGGRVITLPGGYAFTTLEGSSNNRKGSALVITDNQGNVVHAKQFLPAGNNINGLVYHPEDSTFYLWGDCYIGAGQNLYRPYLLKTNWQGDTIWAKEFDYPAYNFCRNALELPDGGFVLLLSTSTPDSSIIGLIRTDKEGNERWHKAYKTGFYHYNNYGLYLKNDSTLLVGYNAERIKLDTLLTPPSDGYGLLEVDLQGLLRFDTFYLTEFCCESAYTGWLTPLGTDKLAFVNRTKTLDPNALQWINAIDLEYNLLWQRYTSAPGVSFPEYIPTLTANARGNIVGGGISAAQTLMPHIFEMTPEGDLLWERLAKSPVAGQDFLFGSSFESIRQTDDGGYIVVGNFQHPDFTFQTWLLKLDSLGCAAPGCETGTFVTVGAGEAPNLPGAKTALVVAPNPADEVAQFRVSSGPGRLSITDVQGRPLETIRVGMESELTIATRDWPPGGYIIRYIGQNGALMGIKKLVVAHR